MMAITMNYAGGLTIRAERDEVEISIEDGKSGVIAFIAKVAPADFLAAIARSSHVDCAFWLNESGNVGATREVKTELVPFNMYGGGKHPKDTDSNGYRTPDTVKALAPFEVDDWSANERDMWNGHNREMARGKAHQRVTFVRFVRPEKASA